MKKVKSTPKEWILFYLGIKLEKILEKLNK